MVARRGLPIARRRRRIARPRITRPGELDMRVRRHVRRSPRLRRSIHRRSIRSTLRRHSGFRVTGVLEHISEAVAKAGLTALSAVGLGETAPAVCYQLVSNKLGSSGEVCARGAYRSSSCRTRT